MNDLLARVKANLIIEFDDDDNLIMSYIAAAVSYAEGFQHLADGFYQAEQMSETTKQGIVMLASFLYESRDGSGAGFFGDSPAAAQQVWNTVNTLLRLDRNWKV